jgi:hypothetical protein
LDSGISITGVGAFHSAKVSEPTKVTSSDISLVPSDGRTPIKPGDSHPALKEQRFLVLGLHVKGNDIGMPGRPAVAELKSAFNATYSKHKERGNLVHKEFFQYSVGVSEKDCTAVDAEVRQDEVIKLPISAEQLQRIQEFAKSFRRTYMLMHFDSGRIANACSGETLGRFFNGLHIQTETLNMIGCDLARKPARIIKGFGETLESTPIIKAYPYPVFVTRETGKKEFKPFRQEGEPGISKEQVVKAGLQHAKYYQKTNGALTEDRSLYFHYTNKALPPQENMPGSSVGLDLGKTLGALAGATAVKIRKLPNDSFFGTVLYRAEQLAYIRLEDAAGKPSVHREGPQEFAVFIKMDGNKHPAITDVGLNERIKIALQLQGFRRTYQIESLK